MKNVEENKKHEHIIQNTMNNFFYVVSVSSHGLLHLFVSLQFLSNVIIINTKDHLPQVQVILDDFGYSL